MAASFKNLNGDHLEDEDVSKSLKSRKLRQPRDPHSISQRYPPGINREFPGVLPTENHIPVDPRHQQYSHADGMTGSQPLPQRGRNQFTGIPSQYQPGMANYVPDRPDIFPPGVNRGPYPLYQAPLIQEPRPMNYSTSEQVQYLASQVQEILLEIREIKGFAGLISEINFKVEQVLDQNNELKDVLDDIQYDVAAMKGQTVLSDHIQEDRSFDEHTTVPEITQQVSEPHNKIKDGHISPPLTRIKTEATPEMDCQNHAEARKNLNTSPTNVVLKDNHIENKKPFVNEREQNTTSVDKEPVMRHDKEQVIRLDKEPVIRVDKEPVIINKKNSVETPEIIIPMKPADTERHFSLVPKNIPQEPVNNIVRSNVDIGTEISMTGRQYKSKKTEQTDDNRISYFNSQSEEDDSDEEIPIAKINPLPPRSPSPEGPTMARPITDDEEELPQIKEDQYLEQLALSENFRARDCLDPKSSGADTVICIDTSDSMAGEPYEKCIDFVSRFIDNIEEWATEYSIEENIAIVHFGKEAKILQQLTNDYNKVREAVETLSIGGPTPMMTGLVVAMSALFNRGGPVTVHNRQINPRVILLSDGHATDHRIFDGRDILQPNGLSGEMIKDKLEDFAERVKLENRYIISIPVGDSPNLEILKPLAETTGGFVSSLDKVKSLSRAFFVEVMISQTRYEGITDEIKTNRQEIAAIARSLQNGKDLTEEEMNEVVTRVIQETEEQIEIEKLREIQRNEIDEESEMEVGLRVRRGKDWIWGDQDGFGTGTVIGHRSRGYVRVKWDCGNVGRYRHGAQNSYDLIVVDEPRILPDDVLIAEGVYVIKGKDWEWDEQDGGEDSVGCVYHFEDEGIVHVRWENGIRGNYRFGGFGKIDLQIITPQDYERIKKRKQQKVERSSGYHDGATGFNIQTDGTVSPNIQTDGPFSPNLQTDDFKPAIGASGYQPHIAANLPEGTGSLGQPEGTVPVDQEIQHIPTETNDKPDPELGVWQYSVNGQWNNYVQSDNERLEKLYKTKKSGTLIININGENCRVNLGKMTQKNTKTNLESEIRRLEK